MTRLIFCCIIFCYSLNLDKNLVGIMQLSSSTRAIPEAKNLQKVLSSFWEIVVSWIQELYKLG